MNFPKGPKIEKNQSRLKISIPPENFNLDWKFQSWPSEFPTENRGLLGGSLEIFNLDWKNFNPGGRSWIFSIFGPLGLLSVLLLVREGPLGSEALTNQVARFETYLKSEKPCPSFPWFFGIPCFFSLRGFPCFFTVFPFFSRHFRGLVRIKNPCSSAGFPCLFPKNKERKDRELAKITYHGFELRPRRPATLLKNRKNPRTAENRRKIGKNDENRRKIREKLKGNN